MFVGGTCILYGNKKGVYWSEQEQELAWSAPVQVLSLPDVSQIDVLEEHNLLICLSGILHLTTFPIAELNHALSTESHNYST